MDIRMIPLIILLIFSGIGLGISMTTHGKQRGKESFIITFLAQLIQWGLILWMVW